MRRVPLPEPVGAPASLWTLPDGGLRVGVPGRVLRLSALGVAEGAPLSVPPGAGAPRPVDGASPADSLLLLRTGPGAVAAVHVDARGGADSASVRDAGSPRAFALDPRGEWLFAGRPGGGVEGWSLPALEPSWGWPEVGRGPAALAVSPLGDRVYVGASGGDGASVRVLDAFSGRELAAAEMPLPAASLHADPAGRLLAVVEEEDGDGVAVLLLEHDGPGLRVVWERSGGELGLRGPLRARIGPAGRSAVVLGIEGVRLLDAATGEVVGRSGEAPLDAAFDRAGRLLLLFPSEVRSVR